MHASRPCKALFGARSASCSASLSNHVSCQKRVPWSNMVTPSFFFATPEGTSGALGTGRSRAVARTTFFLAIYEKAIDNNGILGNTTREHQAGGRGRIEGPGHG